MIKKYKNHIFPRLLVLTDDLDKASKEYEGPDGEPLPYVGNAIATTYRANHKSKDNGCLLIVIFRPAELDTGIIAHEALHVVRAMLEELPCPLTDDTEEVWGYMVGWAANCIADFKHIVKVE